MMISPFAVAVLNVGPAGSDADVTAHEAAANPHPQYAAGNTTALTYTYTGILDAPIVQLPGASESMLASPAGKERAYGALFSQANQRLTGVDFPNLEFISGNFSPSTMAALTSLSLPALTAVGGNFSPSTMAALTSLSLPALTAVGGNFSPSNMAALTSLSLPALTAVGGGFNQGSMAALTSLSLPALTAVGGNFTPNTMAALTSLSLPALTAVGGSFAPGGMAALTSLSVPAIEAIGAALSSGNAISITGGLDALSTFELPATLKLVGGTAGNVTITSAALSQASVDSILVRLAALDGTNGTVAFNNRTVTITGTSAAPSATGLAAKATLVARGCTVTHK